jgi:predicted transposase/invertase (TIGR01784 family)
MEHRSMAALTLLQKHIHQRNLTVLMDKLVAILLTDHLASPQVKTLINYIIQAGETADAEAFVRELALRVPQHGDELMTIAQQLEQKGRKEGIQLGEQRGIALGEQRGIALGEQRGIALGEQRGIALGEQRGIALGEQRGIALGEQRGIALGEQRGIALGEQRGIALGEQRGEQKEKRSNACEMLQYGIDYDIVMKITGLSMEELAALNS